MSWYRAGSIAVTNGSPVVTGTGTAFVVNVQIGHAINLPDGKVYEVAAVNSDTQITLGSNYLGATASGQTYTVTPNQGFAQYAATAIAQLITQVTAYISTALAGRFGDGTAGAPGITFSADQGTGFYRPGNGSLAIVTSGVMRATADATGLTVPLGVNITGAELPYVQLTRNGIGAWKMGAYAAGSNDWDLAFNGTSMLHATNGGSIGIGTALPLSTLHLQTPGDTQLRLANGYGASYVTSLTAASTAEGILQLGNNGVNTIVAGNTATGGYLRFMVNNTAQVPAALNGIEAGRFDSAGNLLVGATSGTSHVFARGAAQGDRIIQFSPTGNPTYGTARFYLGAGNSPAGAATCQFIDANSATGRSINAAGTINASGADYAEYLVRSAHCGTILKADVCGVDAEGKLTTRWADALWFKIKSTDPNLVGGDNWSEHLGDRPIEPVAVQPVYDGPPEPDQPIAPPTPAALAEMPAQPSRDDGEGDDAYLVRLAAFMAELAAWRIQAAAGEADAQRFATATAIYQQAAAAYPAARSTYDGAISAHAADVEAANNLHATALATFASDLAAFETALEAARQTVDRIAYCGQVPVNFAGTCQPGDYLIAVQDGDGIGIAAVAPADITFGQYRARIGAILAIRDGRPWVDVQHG